MVHELPLQALSVTVTVLGNRKSVTVGRIVILAGVTVMDMDKDYTGLKRAIKLYMISRSKKCQT